MPEQKMSYEERLQLAAQKHADKWNKLFTDSDAGWTDAGWTDADCLGDGAVTVAAQAEAIREFANKIQTVAALALPKVMLHNVVNEYLLEHGYIEPKTD